MENFDFGMLFLNTIYQKLDMFSNFQFCFWWIIKYIKCDFITKPFPLRKSSEVIFGNILFNRSVKFIFILLPVCILRHNFHYYLSSTATISCSRASDPSVLPELWYWLHQWKQLTCLWMSFISPKNNPSKTLAFFPLRV